MHRSLPLLAMAGALLLGSAADAEVVQSSTTSFEVVEKVTVNAPVQQAWDTLRSPQKWWNKEHTYSGDSANLYLDSQATGCFCEKLPGKGSVEHGHLVYVEAPRIIRMSSALGPLQAEAVAGTLTIQLDPEGDGATRVTLTYVVAGQVRVGADKMAPLVDKVLSNQVARLKAAAEGSDMPADDAGSAGQSAEKDPLPQP